MSRARMLAAVAACAAAAASPAPAAAVSPARSDVAQSLRRTIALYRSPSAARPYRRLGPITGSYGTRPVFLVRRAEGAWLEVYLPVRPNHSTAWIRRADADVGYTDYRVEVRLSGHRLVLRRNGAVVLSAPIGVGRAVTPTPSGLYFIAYVLRTGDPGGFFGPYAFGLSAFSSVFTQFGGGNGEVGLHGTNQPGLLGHDASHGCIRIANAVIARLVRLLPLGTPVVVER